MSRYIFKAVFDTNALRIILGEILAYRRSGDYTRCKYPNIVRFLENGYLKIFITPTVRREIEIILGPQDARLKLLQELLELGRVEVLEEVECCSSRILRKCVDELDRFLKDESDRKILREFLGYIEKATAIERKRLEEIPLFFVTQNIHDFTPDVVSIVVRSVSEYIQVELQRRGIAPPIGIHTLDYLDKMLRSIVEHIKSRLPKQR